MMKSVDFYRVQGFKPFLRLFKSNSLRNSFVSCFIGCLLIHFHFLANNFVNHDSIVIVSNNIDWVLNQGKWFATPLASLEGPFVVSYISQLIGIVAISISAGIISETFHIKSKLWNVIIGLIMSSFPSVATCLMYLGLDYFGITLFLAILAGYLLIQRGIINYLLGVTLLIISVGSYQAYVGFAVSMLVLDCLIDCIKNEKVNKIIKKGIKYIGSIIISLLGYYIILRIILYKTEMKLGPYAGANNMESNLNPLTLFPSIKKAFISSVNFFAKDNLGVNGPHLFFPGIALLFLIGLSVLLLLKKYKNPFINFIGISLICCLLLSVNFINALANNVSFYYITLFPIIMIPIALVIFNQIFIKDITNKVIINGLLGTFSILVLFFFCFKWIIQDNTAYQKILLNNQQFSAKIGILISKIYSTKGYSNNTEVYVVGNTPYDFLVAYGISAEFNKLHLVGTGLKDAAGEIYDLWILQSYISNQMGININFKKLLDKNLLEDGRIRSMPSYPNDGSITVIDGKIFIKLSQNI